jgi:hypothetical protein
MRTSLSYELLAARKPRHPEDDEAALCRPAITDKLPHNRLHLDQYLQNVGMAVTWAAGRQPYAELLNYTATSGGDNEVCAAHNMILIKRNRRAMSTISWNRH